MTADHVSRRKFLSCAGAGGVGLVAQIHHPGGLPGAVASGGPEPTLIAAASGMRFVLDILIADFAARRPAGAVVELKPLYASSGTLARQAAAGAPFALLLTADPRFTALIRDAGRSIAAHTDFARGRLALFAPATSRLRLDSELDGLRTAIVAGTLRRFAIANPDHAPFGARAREVLQQAGLWRQITPHLALAESVAQAAQFALSGGADGALIALSLALAPTMRDRGRHVVIDAAHHHPVNHTAILLAPSDSPAGLFYRYLLSEHAAGILTKNGFAVP